MQQSCNKANPDRNVVSYSGVWHNWLKRNSLKYWMFALLHHQSVSEFWSRCQNTDNKLAVHKLASLSSLFAPIRQQLYVSDTKTF